MENKEPRARVAGYIARRVASRVVGRSGEVSSEEDVEYEGGGLGVRGWYTEAPFRRVAAEAMEG